MSYELTLSIREDSPAVTNIEAMAHSQHISREEAAIKLLESLPVIRRPLPISADRRAAVEAAFGCARGDDWIIANCKDEKCAEIEREKLNHTFSLPCCEV